MDIYTSQELSKANQRIDALVKRVQTLEEIVRLLRNNQIELMAAQREGLSIMKKVVQQVDAVDKRVA